MRSIFLLIASFSVFSCITEKKDTSITFLGGEIINPKFDYVVIAKSDHIIDTLPLDKHNRFLYAVEKEELGLINFIHGERQLIYLEAGDSLLLRVNTIEFDESLSFTGKGAERSNFLIDTYLIWEQENEGFTQHYQKNPAKFEKFLDSLQDRHDRHLSKFLDKYKVSDQFEEIARAAITLDNYQRKESYPFSHYGSDKLTFINSLPEDFYSFRESINLNNCNLSELYSYQRYLNAFIDNEAFKRYGNKTGYNTVSFVHNTHEIDVINDHFTDPTIKDSKLLRTGRIFLANSNDKNGVEQIFTKLHQNISNEDILDRISQLYTDYKKMEAGNVIPDIMLLDPDQKRKVTLSSRLVKPTVIYFWSYNNVMHMKNSHSKVNELSSKYPEFNFLGINVNSESEMWMRHLDKHNFQLHNEYKFDNAYEGRRKLVINDLSKTIVVDEKGIILNSHSNLHRATFENELLAYLNQ